MLLFHEKVCRCGNPLRDVVLLIIITYLIKKKTQNITRIRSLEGYGAAFMSRLMAEGPTPKLGCIYTLLLFENHLIPSRCMGCACGPRRLQNRSHNQSPYQRLLEGSHIIWDCTSVQQHCGPSSTVRLNICLQPSVHSGTACLKKKNEKKNERDLITESPRWLLYGSHSLPERRSGFTITALHKTINSDSTCDLTSV